MITTIVFALLVAFAIYTVRRIAARKAAAAALLDAAPVGDSQIKENIRRDIAPQNRPYGDGGCAKDNAGRAYAVAKDGSLRRFAVAEKANGEMDVVLVSKGGKARRKAAKKAKRADRGVIVRPVPQATV